MGREIPPKPRALKFYNINFKIYVVIRTACRILRFCHGGISQAVFVAVKFYAAKFFIVKFAAAKFYGVKFLAAEFATVKFYIAKPAPKIPPGRG